MSIKEEFEKAKEHPCWKTYRNIKRRMNLPKTHKNYKHYNNVKNYLTIVDLKFLWARDKAHLLKQPSIDRIDSKGHYTIENCRYIELKQNADQGRANRKQIVYGLFKVCMRCGKNKGINNFRSKGIKRLPHLRHNRCNDCLNARSEKFRKSLPKEVLKERNRKYAKKSYKIRQLAKELS